MYVRAIRRCCPRTSTRPLAGPSRSLTVSAPLLKKGNPRGQAKEAKRAQRSDAKSSAHDIRPSPAPRHPWEGQDDLGATETAEAGLHTEVVSTKGKKSFTSSEVGDDQVEGGKFDIKDVKDGMAKAVDRLRREMNGIVGRVGRLTPALLDGVKVDAGEGAPKPLTSYANVSVRDSEHLTVSCYDSSFVKAVELALYNDPMNLSPLKQGDGSTFFVKVPKVDNATRQKLAKSASDAAESARISIRSVRQAGQKASKSDVNANRITGADHRKDGIALDDEAKRWSKEVDGIEDKAKGILLDR